MKISLCRTGFEDTGYVMKEWLNTEKRWRPSDQACSPVLALLGVMYICTPVCHRQGDWSPRGRDLPKGILRESQSGLGRIPRLPLQPTFTQLRPCF